MTVVPGTTVEVVFQNFTGSFPDLYYGAQGGKLNLASVNAGNSNSGGLCVGLRGVNGGFLRLLSATQKRANLTPRSPGQKQGELPDSCQAGHDDYQDRHLKLLTQADGGGQAWESYSNTDPCAFSLVNSQRISKAAGFEEGVCFVDVFDTKLCPHGNVKNFAMLYAAPPYDGNYTSKAAFLVAIEEMAQQIIRTVSQYNALAQQQQLPEIEALRNTLYSSGFYNSHLKASQEEIARAIFKGFTSQLNLDTNTGLVELQFPVGDVANHQDALFAAVQQDLVQGGNQAHPMLQRIGGGTSPGPGVEMDDPAAGDDADIDLAPAVTDVDVTGEDTTYYVVKRNSLNSAAVALRNATRALDQTLKQNLPLPATIQGMHADNPNYASATSVLVTGEPTYNQVRLYEGLDAAPLKAVRTIAKFGKNFIDFAKLGRIAGDLQSARHNVDNALGQAQVVQVQADNFYNQYNNSGVPAEQNAAEAVKAFASDVTAYARDLNSRLRTAEDLSKVVYRDANGKVSLGRILGPPAFGLAGLAVGAVIGSLTYVFGFGGARVASGNPNPDYLEVGGLDDGNPVDVAVVSLSNLDASFRLTAQLVGNTPGDGWSVSSTDSTHLVYTPTAKPKSGSTAQATYQLVYSDNSLSATATVTITFVDPAVVLVEAATTAKKVTSATFSNLPPQFVFPAQKGWVVNPTGTLIIYTVPGDVDLTKTAAVSANYSSGNDLPKNSSTLVVLFPPTGVTLSMPSRTVATSSSYLPSPGTTGAAWALVDTSMSPAAYPQSLPAKDANGNQIGTWAVVTDSLGSKIQFTPSNLPAGASAPTVPFALTMKVGTTITATAAATASISFTSGVVTQNISSIAPNRTNASFMVAVPDGTTLGGSAMGGGTWSGPTGTAGSLVVTYAPPSPLPTNNQASIQYTSPNQTGTVTLTFPHDIQRDTLSRIDIVSIDFKQEYPDLTITSVAVTGLNPSQDGSGGTWSPDPTNSLAWDFTPPAGNSAITPLEWDATVMAYTLTGAPGVKPVQVDTVKKGYTLTLSDGSTTSAELTLDFTPTTALTAYGITYSVKSGSGATAPIVILDYCYFPSGDTFNSATRNDPPFNGTSAGGGSQGAPTYTLNYQNLTTTSPTVTFTYEVLDFQGHSTSIVGPGQTTILTPMNVTLSAAGMMVMPKAADYLLAKDVWSAGAQANEVGADVLGGCSAYFGIDPSTLELTGLLDMGSGWAAPAAFREPDGKGVRVPGEGCWHVAEDTSDNNAIKIGFVMEQGLVNSPTPIGYRFRDLQGNLSNQGILMMDPDLGNLEGLQSAVNALDDKAFWDYFQKNVIWWVDGNGYSMEADHVSAAAMLLAGVTRTLGKVGGNPIDSKELSDAYDGWVQNGKQWHEKSGQEDSKCLFSICRDLVDKNTAGTTLTYRARHWRLLVLARMMSYTTMLPLIQN
jgi:hypothetical protein